ncbi:Transcriptional factor [Mycena venus]|uniref:Transcriptional factor n=1 Tax=Mycena venus TaxID=2733690 RepID=A0A8H7D505_9AGAR|nr:Transcriptional factor [Mycena venus]
MSAAIRPASVNQTFANPNQPAVPVQKQLQPHPGPAVPASQLPASLKRKQAQIAIQTTDDETQDEARPCQRCVKRGIAANCTEGHRKKAKYLLDEEELEKLKSRRGKSLSVPEASVEPSPVQPAAAPQPPPPPPPLATAQPPFDPGDQMFTPVPFDPSFPFGSEAANLEYSILSAILGNPSPPETTTSPDPSAAPGSCIPSSRGSPSTLGHARPALPARSLPNAAASFRPSQSSGSSFANAHHEQSGGGGGSQLQNINDRVTMPYDYTEGYHFLMKHLPGRFEKNDILRIVRALAIFRPSLIALQMPLSFDDEVFVEKCFQRSLLELDKLISFSGTPTVVWRRTGEICLVAPEFCMLTEWSLDELVGRKKYIYELFENQSVVEYWENFASHAFENTTQSVYSHCVLLKPNGAPVPSTFCFSVRRDLFDLPSVVIGQWLPLL